jgi:uncharacterized membrane protein YsdA (DUF1294 family)
LALRTSVASFYATGKPPKKAFRWRLDLVRLLRMALFGGVFGGPLGHFWFRFLDEVWEVPRLMLRSARVAWSKRWF